jgi:cell division protein FtsW
MSLIKYIKGDKSVWVITIFLAIASLLLVYSSSSGLAYSYYEGNTFRFLLKHLVHLMIGFGIMLGVANLPYKYFYNLSLLLYVFSLTLLLFAGLTGNTIGNANAARWISVFGFSFQPSELAKVSLMMFLARNLLKYKDVLHSFKKSFIPIMGPVILSCSFILPSNFSTAAIIFCMSMLIMVVGKYSVKNLMIVLAVGLVSLSLFIGLVKVFPNISNRVTTWIARIENFQNNDKEGNYQVNKAKTAIVLGGMWGQGPGKSVQKYFLPQSSSDFIFAIIVEEYGMIGGIMVILLYLLLMIRFMKIMASGEDPFATLLVAGIGFSILFQAMINMAVAVNLFPVTGQTLPLISAGGSSVWMTCAALGVILSVSNGAVEEQMEEEKEMINPEEELGESMVYEEV